MEDLHPDRTILLLLLTLNVVSESRMTWATSVLFLVFLGLTVLDLGPMYATDVRQKHRLMPPPYGGGGIIMYHGRLCGKHIDAWVAESAVVKHSQTL